MRYNKFNIWPYEIKVKVIANIDQNLFIGNL